MIRPVLDVIIFLSLVRDISYAAFLVIYEGDQPPPDAAPATTVAE